MPGVSMLASNEDNLVAAETPATIAHRNLVRCQVAAETLQGLLWCVEIPEAERWRVLDILCGWQRKLRGAV